MDTRPIEIFSDSMKKLINKLNYFNEVGAYDKIISMILEIPEEERDYELISHLARAYNNYGTFVTQRKEEYLEAITLLLSVKEEGKNDPLWYYRMGYGYMSLNINDKALKYFKKSYELDDSSLELEELLEILEIEVKLEKIAIDEQFT